MNDTVTLLTRRADFSPASANSVDRTVERCCGAVLTDQFDRPM
jgi:hypothetical protein